MRATGAESRVVMIDGHRIHYYVSGPANGVAYRSGAWPGRTFRRFRNPGALSGRRPAIASTRPICWALANRKSQSNASYSISDQADLVAEFFDAMGLNRADLGGWSMGGWIAQKVAVDIPRRVSRLILMDSAGLMVPPTWDTRLFTPDYAC